MNLDHYGEDNLANWNDRVPIHAAPDGYGIEAFESDPTLLTDVVEFDRTYPGDVFGLTMGHTQCHIGTDSLSWTKFGARVVGIDFSEPALGVARSIAGRLDIEARFVESEVSDIPDNLPEQFDIVYTGVGAVNWLPDIDGWAGIMAGLVRPGGRFYIREGHPMLWALDDERDDDLLVLGHPYFETREPSTFQDPITYTGSETLDHPTIHAWNHGFGEVINALIKAGSRIDVVEEHRFLEWPTLPMMIEENGRYRLPDHLADRVPLMYSLLATLSQPQEPA
jgi:SAM-dependent methyltransferase